MFSNYTFTRSSAAIMVIQKIALKSSWERASFYVRCSFFFFFFKQEVRPYTFKSEANRHVAHPDSILRPSSFCSQHTSPAVPSRGTGTILLCGSPAGPGQGRHLLPCCFEAVRNKDSVVKQPCTFRDKLGMGMQPCLWPWKEYVVLYINGHNQAEKSLLCPMFSLNMGLMMTIFTS